ncbi:MAG: trigger factor [Planctomycetes bacterium]|nr:trigger factor [Planctomycetota bacterium]
MQVQVAETGPCSRTLSIQLPPSSVQEHLDELFSSATKQAQRKGFRPGKVPRKFIEKHHGPEILREAKEQLVNSAFNEACRQQELTPVGRVRIDDFEQLEVKPGASFEFKVMLDVRPKFDLKETKGLKVDTFEAEANDTDVDNALNEIANQKRAIKSVTEPAKDGDFVKADLLFVDAGGAVVLERKGTQLNTRIPIAGSDAGTFATALTGAEKGQQVEVPVTFPENFEKDSYRGTQGMAKITVHEVLRVLPAPIDDSMAKLLDFESLDALRLDLKSRIAQEKVRAGKARQEDQCLEQLVAAHDFPLPASLIEEQQEAALQNFAERMKQKGMAKDEIDKKLEESKDEASQDGQRRVRLFFLIEAIARQQKLFVTETDVNSEIQNLALANNASPEQVVEHLEKNKQLGELRLAILERKVRNFLRDSATIVDKKAK